MSIGVASGIVFCGIIGHSVRHEYTGTPTPGPPDSSKALGEGRPVHLSLSTDTAAEGQGREGVALPVVSPGSAQHPTSSPEEVLMSLTVAGCGPK